MILHHLTSRSFLMIFLRLVEGLRSPCEAKVKYKLNKSCPEYKAPCLCSVVFLILSLTYKTKMYNARDQPRTLACRALSVKFFFPLLLFLSAAADEWVDVLCVYMCVCHPQWVCLILSLTYFSSFFMFLFSSFLQYLSSSQTLSLQHFFYS